MKIIYCRECRDVVRLEMQNRRYCRCQKSYGHYTDKLNATVGGPCFVIGVDNYSFARALRKRQIYNAQLSIDTFFITEDCNSVNREN